jgi:chromosome segregation ATPase
MSEPYQIAELKEENARLKAEVERLGWVSAGSVKFIDHTMELARQATRHHKEMERLKAECQARQAENSVLAVECDSLKAEVERLTSDIQMEKENEDRLVREWQKANNEVYGLHTQVAALIDDQTRLKAQVERLTKAGDELHAFLINYIVESRISSSYLNKLDDDWQAAKEGKQP